ncbi:MAG: hypothetical protein JWO82_1356, partial [Akkermansiaceae bacterium]|nr:hypothetical protein [Akkermansiaceae bacterium]
FGQPSPSINQSLNARVGDDLNEASSYGSLIGLIC